MGGFATTWVSNANRYGVFRSLVPCTAAIPNPGPQILLQQIREEGGGSRGGEGGGDGGGLLSARRSIIIPTSASLFVSKTDKNWRETCLRLIPHLWMI